MNNARVEQKLGFDRIREQVAQKCTIASAIEVLSSQGFSSSVKEVTRRLNLSEEMCRIIQMESGYPSDGYVDVTPIVAKIAIDGSFLEIDEVGSLRSSLRAAGAIISFITSKGEGRSYPVLVELCGRVDSMPWIVQTIDSILDKFNQVKDNASPELAEIIQSIREREGRAAKRLQQILQSAKSSGIVDSDVSLSIRDGRAVIPVSAANKRKLQGFVHDESATGKTVFIEPVEVVEINNELRELEYARRREIVRILSSFTEQIRPHTQELSEVGALLAQIDMIRAKARFAIENECVRPILSRDGRMELKQARHPLLAQTLKAQGREIIPLDMELTPQKHILVISGPNAGGKSVCLKSVGLIQYMFQCGYLIPASQSSELPLFRAIYIDIGDEQSIDNDLSTYSSHLMNMKQMLSGAGEGVMVLLDEFGAGTEPVIGGAMAEAILDRLLVKGCYGVITTHYANLKYYASHNEGIANGAMAFDVQNIRPLFRLEMGKPGSSFAIEIARKIGLPEDIIMAAKQKAGSEHVDLEKQLREIARDKRYWEQKRDRIRITDRRVEELENNYSQQLAKIKAERAEIIAKAKREAKELIAQANKSIETTIKSIREASAEKEFTRLARRELEEFKESVEQRSEEGLSSEDVAREMERIERRQRRRKERQESKVDRDDEVEPVEKNRLPLEVGSKVRIAGQDTLGEVQSIKGAKAQVAFGHILTTVSVDNLTVISNSEFKKSSKINSRGGVVSVDVSSRRLNFKDNIDVRGMRASEALDKVEGFIDDAIMVGISSVAILHGKGTGALKEEIRRYLRTIPDVARAVDAHADRGGAGITVVEFKE
ncbi:MAG: Smr/MutS family protein [Rikenellaceae bacterium]